MNKMMGKVFLHSTSGRKGYGEGFLHSATAAVTVTVTAMTLQLVFFPADGRTVQKSILQIQYQMMHEHTKCKIADIGGISSPEADNMDIADVRQVVTREHEELF